ncbi:MAG: hypothetical protein DWH82_07075 [Planctomycetota bacterium]|nr:MAG: hypothetical protein DWH82_07075 [Planctomycetota bacterium]
MENIDKITKNTLLKQPVIGFLFWQTGFRQAGGPTGGPLASCPENRTGSRAIWLLAAFTRLG